MGFTTKTYIFLQVPLVLALTSGLVELLLLEATDSVVQTEGPWFLKLFASYLSNSAEY